MDKKNDFEYTYSAPTAQERKEIESIRNNYITNAKVTGKLARLRYLDNKVKNIPTCVALILGIIGTLIFGLGLSMVLEWELVWQGCLVAVIGAIPMIISYPIYKLITNKLKNKYSEEILKISDELLNDGK